MALAETLPRRVLHAARQIAFSGNVQCALVSCLHDGLFY